LLAMGVRSPAINQGTRLKSPRFQLPTGTQERRPLPLASQEAGHAYAISESEFKPCL
jgi:hypothetical protein